MSHQQVLQTRLIIRSTGTWQGPRECWTLPGGRGEQQHCQPLFHSQPSSNRDAEKTRLKISLLSPSAFHVSHPEVGEWQLQGKHHLLLQQGAEGSKSRQNRCSLASTLIKHCHQTAKRISSITTTCTSLLVNNLQLYGFFKKKIN